MSKVEFVAIVSEVPFQSPRIQLNPPLITLLPVSAAPAKLHVGGSDGAVDVERAAIQINNADQVRGCAAGEIAAAGENNVTRLRIEFAGVVENRARLKGRVAARAAGFAERAPSSR